MLAVFFNQVVDVAKNTTVKRLRSAMPAGINWESEKRTTCLRAVIEANERIKDAASFEKQTTAGHTRAPDEKKGRDVETETRGLGSEGYRRR